MAKEQYIRIFSAGDIEKYHQGQLSSSQMHDLEKAALDDPFLADALEGYSASGVDFTAELADLNSRLEKKVEEKSSAPVVLMQKSSFSWWKVAAIVILLAGAGTLTYRFGFSDKATPVANNYKKDTVTIKNSFTETDEKAKEDEQQKETTPAIAPVVVPKTSTAEKKTNEIAADDKKVSEGKKNTDLARKVTKEKDKPADVPGAVSDKLNAKTDGVVTQGYKTSEAETVQNNPVADIAANSKAKSRSFLSNNVFRGRVMDAQNNALPFANITNTIDNVGTYTDAKGFFTLTSPDSMLNVQVKSLGFENSNIQLRNITQENRVMMQEDRSLSARVLDTVRRNAFRSRNSTMVLEEPEPADGWMNYDTYLANNLNIPDNFKPRQSTGGEVELSFEVNQYGEPINIKVEKSLCESCDKEAVRLVKEGPKWKRKAKKGRTTVTVAF